MGSYATPTWFEPDRLAAEILGRDSGGSLRTWGRVWVATRTGELSRWDYDRLLHALRRHGSTRWEGTWVNVTQGQRDSRVNGTAVRFTG